MPNVTEGACSSSEDDKELRRGPWTVHEDTLLIHYIACHGEGRWNLLAKSSGLRRTGKSCRLRWLNYLKPDIKRGNLTPQEQLLILELHSKWGNRWSRIAKYLPGRTDNEIKNYWRTRVHKQARNLNIDSNCVTFRDAIRSFWIPRLVQKMESSSTTMESQTSSTPAIILNHTPHVPPQALQVSELTNSANHPDINQTSVNYISSSISVSDSLNIPQKSEITEYQSMGSILHNPLQKACSYEDNASYDMKTFNLDSMSAPGDINNWAYPCHMVEANWVEDDVADSPWDMDELWEFKKL